MHWQKPFKAAGLVPWACTYDGLDGEYGLTLHGASPDQIIRDHSIRFPGLRVEGELVGVLDEPDLSENE